MIGRLEELKELESVLVQVGSGRLGTCLFEGEPGIGKSLLLAKGKERALFYGFQVFSAQASEFEIDRPFGLLHDALSPLRNGSTKADHKRETLDPPGGGGHFLEREALIDLIEGAAMTSPLLIALDDLQWADPSSISALPEILHRLRDLPIAVILAFRHLPQEQELRNAIRSLVAMGASRIKLRSLEERELRDLLQGVLHSAPSDELINESVALGGNPLLTLELADASRRASTQQGASREISIPETVRSALLGRMEYLSDESVQLLKVASVLGGSFTVIELATLMGQQPTAIAALLDEALECGVLLSRTDRIEFRHDLIREAVYTDLAPSIRKGFHRQAAETLQDLGRDPFVIARHMRLSALKGDVGAAQHLGEIAAQMAREAPRQAVQVLEEAVGLLNPADPLRKTLLAQMLKPLGWIGDLDSVKQAESIASLVLASGIQPEVAQQVRSGLVEAFTLVSRYSEAAEIIQDELRNQALSDFARADCLASLAYVRAESRRLDEAVLRIREAEPIAERSGNRHAEFLLLLSRAIVLHYEGRFYESLALLEPALKGTHGDDRLVSSPLEGIRSLFYVCSAQINLDMTDRAEDSARRGQALCESTGSSIWLPNFMDLRARAKFYSGSWDDSIAEAEAAIAIAEELGWPAEWLSSSGLIVKMKLARGDVEGARKSVAKLSMSVGSTVNQIRIGILKGKEDDALDLLDRHLKDITGRSLGVFDVRTLGPEIVELALRDEREDLAVRLSEAAGAFAVQVDVPSAKGIAQLSKGLITQDPEHLSRAVAAYRTSMRPYETGMACELAGKALWANRQDEATECLVDALSHYDMLKCVTDASRLRAAMRKLGIKVTPKVPKAQASQGWAALTPTELRVAKLAAKRLTNPEIADQLFISKRTVQTHLSHIFAKLDISSRVQLSQNYETQT